MLVATAGMTGMGMLGMLGILAGYAGYVGYACWVCWVCWCPFGYPLAMLGMLGTNVYYVTDTHRVRICTMYQVWIASGYQEQQDWVCGYGYQQGIFSYARYAGYVGYGRYLMGIWWVFDGYLVGIW